MDAPAAMVGRALLSFSPYSFSEFELYPFFFFSKLNKQEKGEPCCCFVVVVFFHSRIGRDASRIHQPTRLTSIERETWSRPSFPPLRPVFTEFYRLLPSFTGFYRLLLGFTGFYRVSPGFTGFYVVLLGFT